MSHTFCILTINLHNFHGDKDSEIPQEVGEDLVREIGKCVDIINARNGVDFVFTQEDYSGLHLRHFRDIVRGSTHGNEGTRMYMRRSLEISLREKYGGDVYVAKWEHRFFDENSRARSSLAVVLPSGHTLVNVFFPGGRYEDAAFFYAETLPEETESPRMVYLEQMLEGYQHPDILGGDFNACPQAPWEATNYPFDNEYVQGLIQECMPKTPEHDQKERLRAWLHFRNAPFQHLTQRGYGLHFPSASTAFQATLTSPCAVDGFAVLSSSVDLGANRPQVYVIEPALWQKLTDHAPVLLRVTLKKHAPPTPPMLERSGATSIERETSLSDLFSGDMREISPPRSSIESSPARPFRVGLLFRGSKAGSVDDLQRELSARADTDPPGPLSAAMHIQKSITHLRSLPNPPTTPYTSWSKYAITALRYVTHAEDHATYKSLLILCPRAFADVSTQSRAEYITKKARTLAEPTDEMWTWEITDGEEPFTYKAPLEKMLNMTQRWGPAYQQVLVDREHLLQMLEEHRLFILPLDNIRLDPRINALIQDQSLRSNGEIEQDDMTVVSHLLRLIEHQTGGHDFAKRCLGLQRQEKESNLLGLGKSKHIR